MPGRNDPCPCGSGKKYKHCCLKKDEAARRAAYEEAERVARAADAAPPLFPQPPPPRFSSNTGMIDARGDQLDTEGATNDAFWDEPASEQDIDADLDPFEARWAEFRAAKNYEGQIAIFLATLDDGLMDDDNAFEMLDTIYEATAAAGERDRFDPLVALLRQRVPDVYASEAHVCLDWLISNALVAGRLEVLPALADELAGTASEHVDTVTRVLDRLAYHGQLSVLAAAARRAWPHVRDASEYFEWVVSEFAERGMTMAMLDYVERTASPNAADLEALGADFDRTMGQPGGAAQFLAYITGQAGRRWTLDDFSLTAPPRRKGASAPLAGDGRANLHDLTVEFLGYLRREEGVSYAKGELARQQMERYLVERHAGESTDVRRSKSRTTEALASLPVHPLCPDRATLDRHLADLLHLFNMQPHKAAALFELVPAWLRFLEGRELIDSQQRQQTLSELTSLNADLTVFWTRYNTDPALWLAAQRWQEEAGLV